MDRMTDSGLTRQEAQRRLLEQGENRLKTGKKNSAVLIFAGQFKDGMVLILLAATALSAVLGEQGEALAIAAIVLANALLGFFQEWRCEKTLEALEEMAAPTRAGPPGGRGALDSRGTGRGGGHPSVFGRRPGCGRCSDTGAVGADLR